MDREELIVLIGYGCVSLVVTSLIESVVS